MAQTIHQKSYGPAGTARPTHTLHEAGMAEFRARARPDCVHAGAASGISVDKTSTLWFAPLQTVDAMCHVGVDVPQHV